MMVLDVNVVLALHAREWPTHATATRWLAESSADGQTFAVPTTVWHSFLRLATNASVKTPPTSISEAWAFVEAFRRRRDHSPAEPGRRHFAILQDLCVTGQVRAALVPDAVIAAIAVENGAAVASFDRDFARFPALRWVVPGA